MTTLTIKEINYFKLLTRLKEIEKMKDVDYKAIASFNILNSFKCLYPDIDISVLRDSYEIENNKRIYPISYGEYETKQHEGYEELLTLSNLCIKHLGYSPFRTMIGEIFYSAEDFKAYEVIYIQEEFKSEQIFVLLNQEHNLVKTVKVDEWSCGRLNSHGELYSSKENMIKAYEKISYNKFQSTLERIEKLKKEL